MTLYQEELTLARSLVRRAGTTLKNARHSAQVLKQPHGFSYLDVTTSADLESETLILEGIGAAYPADRILSEETRTNEDERSGRLWIVDPLDGTTNFVKGLDAYAISIALVVDGHVVMAACYLPEYDKDYTAVRGAGMYSNGALLSVSSPEDTLAESLVSVGFPHERGFESLKQAFAMYRTVLAESSDLRRSASAVFDGCLLATGATGAYLTPDIKPWDIVAMILFIEEQGGVVSDFRGNPLNLFKKRGDYFSVAVVCAKNPTIHASMITVTSQYA